MKYEEIVDKISASVNEQIVSVAKQIEFAYAQLNDIISEKLSEQTKLDTLKKECADIIDETKNLSKVRRESEDIIAKASQRSVELAEMEERVYADIDKFSKVRDSLKADADSILEKLADLNKKKEERQVLIDELKEIAKQIDNSKKELIKLDKEKTSTVDSIESMKFQFDRSILDKEEKLKTDRSELEQRLRDVNTLQAKLTQKEADLGTIEARWYKLFGEKGLSFKI